MTGTDAVVERLVERAIAGDAGAQDALLRRFEPVVRAVAHRHLGQDLRGVVDTDDLVQTTLAAAVAGLGLLSYRGEVAFRAWLVQVTRHRVQMAGRHHRAQRRDVHRNRRLDTALPVEGRATGPFEHAAREDQARQIRTAVARLTADDRLIIEMRSFEGRPFPEIAAALGLAGESSARQRFQRALRRLAVEMDG